MHWGLSYGAIDPKAVWAHAAWNASVLLIKAHMDLESSMSPSHQIADSVLLLFLVSNRLPLPSLDTTSTFLDDLTLLLCMACLTLLLGFISYRHWHKCGPLVRGPAPILYTGTLMLGTLPVSFALGLAFSFLYCAVALRISGRRVLNWVFGRVVAAQLLWFKMRQVLQGRTYLQQTTLKCHPHPELYTAIFDQYHHLMPLEGRANLLMDIHRWNDARRDVLRIRSMPEFKVPELKPVVVITGLPRTGSTLLLRLLSLDAAAHSLSGKKAFFGPGQASSTLPDFFFDHFTDQAMFNDSHPIKSALAEEELALMEREAVTMGIALVCCTPEKIAVDYAPTYEWLTKELQVHQALQQADGPAKQRWVLKSPIHLLNMVQLRSTFPGLKVIRTTRRHDQVYPSLCRLTESWGSRYFGDNFSKSKIGWRVGHYLDYMVHAGSSSDYDFLCDYENLVADPVATVKQIYCKLGLQCTPQYENSMRDFLDAHPIGRYGRATYSCCEYELGAVNSRAYTPLQQFDGIYTPPTLKANTWHSYIPSKTVWCSAIVVAILAWLLITMHTTFMAYSTLLPLSYVSITAQERESHLPGSENTLMHVPGIADHTAVHVNMNVDVIYSEAFLNLSEPVMLTVPEIPPQRFHDLQLLDAFTTTTLNIGNSHPGECNSGRRSCWKWWLCRSPVRLLHALWPW